MFSYAYAFDFQAWYVMFIIRICVTNNCGHRCLVTRFFYKQRFFSATVLINIHINVGSKVAQVLYKYHHTETLHMFTVFVSGSTPRSMCAVFT